MKIISILILLLTGTCQSKGTDTQNKAEEIFRSNINVVENFLLSGRSEGQALSNAISFLEELTGIEAYSDENYSEEKLPNIFNLEDWKSWFEINKAKLVWDGSEEKVKLGEPAIPLTKDPKEEFRKYIDIVEKNTKSENIDLDVLIYAVRFLENITGIESEEFDFSASSDLPTKETIEKWKGWYDKNGSFLYWDEKSQKIEKKMN